MRRLLLIIFVIALSLHTSAETSSVLELSAGGGWSSLGYSLNTTDQPRLTASQPGSYGYTAHVGYGLMFNAYIGLGIGVDYSRYGATATLGGAMQHLGVTDTEGEHYNHTTEIHSWQDVQELSMLEVPLSLYLRAPLRSDRTAIVASLGALVGFPMSNKASYKGETAEVGSYDVWQLTLQDVPGHGFGSIAQSGEYSLSPCRSYAAFFKLGVETALGGSSNVFFFAHAYGTYYFMPALTMADSPVDLDFTHYTSILNTKLVQGKAQPISAGLEVGFRFRITHWRHYKCRCLE